MASFHFGPFAGAMAFLGLASTCFAQAPMVGSPGADTPFQVRYAANLGSGESYINIGNDGAQGSPLLGPGFSPATGNICVSVYAIDPGEELVACCSCLVTPDQMIYLGANTDLLSVSPGFDPVTITIKLIATTPAAGVSPTDCTNEAALSNTTPVNGMVAWGTTLHRTPGPGITYATTESPFVPVTLSVSEFNSLTGRCAAIIGNTGASGICMSCHNGALGAVKK